MKLLRKALSENFVNALLKVLSLIHIFEGRDKCNDFAIGIELEGSNEQPFTEEQYQVLAALTRDIMQAYPKKMCIRDRYSSIAGKFIAYSSQAKLIDTPLSPARPVRPIR